MKDKIAKYFQSWYTVIVRPIYFYVTMDKDPWQGEALTFASMTAWILAFAITICVFVIQYVPIGLYMLEGNTSSQLLLTLPVILLLSFTFFAMTLLIIGGVMLGLVIGSMYVFGAILQLSLQILGVAGKFNETLKAVLYSSATLLFAILPIAFFIPTKYKMVETWQLQALYDIMYFVASIYIYGLWSIAVKKAQNMPRWKAVLAASIPFVILVFIGILFHYKVFPRLEKFLA